MLKPSSVLFASRSNRHLFKPLSVQTTIPFYSLPVQIAIRSVRLPFKSSSVILASCSYFYSTILKSPVRTVIHYIRTPFTPGLSDLDEFRSSSHGFKLFIHTLFKLKSPLPRLSSALSQVQPALAVVVYRSYAGQRYQFSFDQFDRLRFRDSKRDQVSSNCQSFERADLLYIPFCNFI
jgi:hypothetical protein